VRGEGAQRPRLRLVVAQLIGAHRMNVLDLSAPTHFTATPRSQEPMNTKLEAHK
jgi:hypothetical protein